MKVLDLFSGIGGFSLGLERAGMETVAFCEVDKDCHKILKKHWPKVPIYTDVSELSMTHGLLHSGEDSPEVDILFDKRDVTTAIPFGTGDVKVVCGGFPCQDLSNAGKQRGLIDPKKYSKALEEGKTHEEAERYSRTRSGLWFEYKRIIKETRPTYVLIENVGALLNNGLVTVLQDLWALGYDAEWHIISAKSITPSWHERKRVWIVAVPHGHGFRLCEEALTTKEEKQKWWTKATATLRSWWPSKPTFRGTVDGLPGRLDKPRQIRIKQLGNAVIPQISEFIGRRIMEYEGKRK